MIKNYIKIAWRNIWKSKLYSSINILGLGIGLAACLLIGLYIESELKYDKFHKKADDIVRVTMDWYHSGTQNKVAVTGTQVGPEFHRSIPGIKDYARTYIGQRIFKKDNQTFEENKVLFADVNFFNIFSFDFIHGVPENALDAPDKIVLTESTAVKYFGDQNPVGKTFSRGTKEYRVSGVCINPPQHSQLKFDFVTHFYNISENVKTETFWTANWITYLLLDQNTNIQNLEKRINDYMDSDPIRTQTGAQDPDFLHYHLEPLTKVHLHSNLAGHEPTGSIKYIFIFVLIAVLILLTASANYTNLAIAQSMGRTAEIGTRKVLGASKNQIFFQFLGESGLITFLSATLALCISILCIPYFNYLSGKDFLVSDIIQPIPIALIIIFGILISFLAGLYPSLILARTKVIKVLKSGFSSTNKGSNSLRQSLIIGQFAVSIFLISFTVIVINQVQFVKQKKLGYDRDHVVVLPMTGDMLDNFDINKEAFQNVLGVENITASYETPEFVQWGDGVRVETEEGKKDISINAMPIDLDFAKTLGMEFVAGRDFIRSDFAMMDTTNNQENYRQPYIINETLAKKIGWTPEEAIGKQIENRAIGPVVGVLKDFHFSSLHEPIGPMIQFLGRDFARVFLLKINGGDISGTLSRLENVWTTRNPERPFSYHFLDEDYNKLYAAEERSTSLFKTAAILAILLATMGLFGLAAFITLKRTKEIGIRRVLGASFSQITFLFTKKFIFLIAVSTCIAIPFAYWAGAQWLQDFTYRIPLSWWHFTISSLLVLSIAIITICYHTLKACLVNPSNSLRTE